MPARFLLCLAFLASLGAATEASACRNPPPPLSEDVREARLIDGAVVIALGVAERFPETEIFAEVRPTEVLRGSAPDLILIDDEVVVTDCPSSSVPNLPWRWEGGDEVLVIMTMQAGRLRPYDVSLLSGARGQRLLARARASTTAAQ